MASIEIGSHRAFLTKRSPPMPDSQPDPAISMQHKGLRPGLHTGQRLHNAKCMSNFNNWAVEQINNSLLCEDVTELNPSKILQKLLQAFKALSSSDRFYFKTTSGPRLHIEKICQTASGFKGSVPAVPREGKQHLFSRVWGRDRPFRGRGALGNDSQI